MLLNCTRLGILKSSPLNTFFLIHTSILAISLSMSYFLSLNQFGFWRGTTSTNVDSSTFSKRWKLILLFLFVFFELLCCFCVFSRFLCFFVFLIFLCFYVLLVFDNLTVLRAQSGKFFTAKNYTSPLVDLSSNTRPSFLMSFLPKFLCMV